MPIVHPHHLPLTLLTLAIAVAYTSHAAADVESVKTLPTVVVEDSAIVKKPAASAKTDTPLLETPLSVQVISRETLDQQQIISVKDAVQNVSGVVQADYEFYDFLQIRGFKNGYAANYRNGLQLQAVTGLETALVERIEVVKGPASMLYGRIEPGGLVNLVTKRPLDDERLSIQQQVGSDDLYRTTLDKNGRITDDGKLLYRVIGAYTDAKSFMDHVQKENAVGAAYFAWRPTDNFSFNLDLERQNNRFMDTEDQGIPIIGDRPAPVSRDSYYGDPVNWDIPNRQKRNLVSYDWTYVFSEQWKLTQRLHWDTRDEKLFTIWYNDFDGVDTLSRGLWYVHPERDTLATNIDMLGDVQIADLRHRVLIGVDWFDFTSTWTGLSGTTDLVPEINIYHPTYGLDEAGLRALDANFFYYTRDTWKGLYMQDQISLSNDWELLLGARYDKSETGVGYSENSLYEARTSTAIETDHAISSRVGLLRQFGESTSVYVSYAESFGANNGRSFTGEVFDPQKGKQWEAGVKTLAMDGHITATASVFVLDKTNILTADLDTPEPDDQKAIGKARSQGIELDVTGQLTDNLSLIASYTYDEAKVTRDNDGNQGNTLPNVPRHAASFWSLYDTAPGSKRGWDFGAGLYLRGEREGNNANTWQLPGYGRVDASVGYRLPVGAQQLSLQLNAKNLLDQEYFDRGGGTIAKYGEPRTLIGSVELTF